MTVDWILDRLVSGGSLVVSAVEVESKATVEGTGGLVEGVVSVGTAAEGDVVVGR